jgi:succinyl-diaminopimelate desuccinylase
VIPASARATFNIRFNDRWSPASLAAEIRRRIEAAAGNAVRWEVTFDPSNATAFLTAPGPFVSLVADAVQQATGRTPALSTTGGTSDARFIKDYFPVLEFGLVGQTMHKVDERVPTADVERLTAIFEDVLARYFAAG